MELPTTMPATILPGTESQGSNSDLQAVRGQPSLYAQPDLARSVTSAFSLESKSEYSQMTIQEGNAFATTEVEPQPLTEVIEHASRRKMDHDPAIQSPLNPFKDGSISSNENSNDDEAHIYCSQPAFARVLISKNGNSRHDFRLALAGRVSAESLPALPTLETPFDNCTLGSPRSFEKLGQEYTRYPVYSRKVSASDLLNSSRSYTNYSTPFARSVTSLSAFNGTSGLAEARSQEFQPERIAASNTYFVGEKGFILYPDEVEGDDADHLPADDDDIRYRAKWSDYLNRKTFSSTIGGVFLCLGLLILIVMFPVLTFGGFWFPYEPAGTATQSLGNSWDWVNDVEYPLLKNVRQGLVDPDTPADAKTRASFSSSPDLKLVFSDEFKIPNRSFFPGDDPFWTGADLWYGATGDLEWYDPDAATTFDGTLMLQLDKFINHGLEYRSGMLNSWNQLCFKGGIMEVSVSLPGPASIPGLWPGIWTMGNLGRPGYRATTDGVWPYTYNSCDTGITPNQSSPDGTSFLPGQRLASCTCPNEDHPNTGTGRGAPEIDVLEAAVDYGTYLPIITQSYQVAPFDMLYRPNAEFMAIPNDQFTIINPYNGGVYQQAVSGTTLTNPAWFDGEAYQRYGFEYTPGGPADGGRITWFVGNDASFVMDSRAIGPNGNIGQRIVSEEPMSLIFNLGFSNSWTWIDHEKLKFPTTMRVDYVRIYQKEGSESVTCDPEGYPTTEYIRNHPKAYENVNLTSWDETGYPWPKNNLMSSC